MGYKQGLLTELAWPTLEEAAVAVLAEGRPARPGDPAPRVRLHEAWPAIGVLYDGHVKFVDGDQVVASASFAPQGATDPRIWEYTLVEGVIGCHYAVEYEGGVVWSHEPSRLTPGGVSSLGPRGRVGLDPGPRRSPVRRYRCASWARHARLVWGAETCCTTAKTIGRSR